MLTHSNMSSNVMQFLEPGGTNHQMATSNYQDTYVCLLPFFHTYGITIIMNTGFETGAKLVTLPQFEVQSFFKAIDEHKVNKSYQRNQVIRVESKNDLTVFDLIFLMTADSYAYSSATGCCPQSISSPQHRVLQPDAHHFLWSGSFERAIFRQALGSTKQPQPEFTRRYNANN